MKYILVHPSLNRYGGAELICLEMIKALRERGHRVELYTIERVDWGELGKRLGEYPRPDLEYSIHGGIPWYDGLFLKWFIYMLMYTYLLLKAARGDAVVVNNYGDVIPLGADYCYVHSIPVYSSKMPGGYNPYQVPLWWFTSRLVRLWIWLLSPFMKRSRVITNSRYNASYLNGDALILYPPVNTEGITDVEKVEGSILTVSRLNRMKKLEVIPEIAALMKPGCHFFIIGSRDGKSDLDVEISLVAESLGVRDRVTISVDPSRGEILRWFASSMVFLSTQPTEAFGIAVVEAMAAGCVPVVPRSGGPWLDILDMKQGEYGYSYETPEEAAALTSNLLEDEALFQRLSKRVRVRAQIFTGDAFRESFCSIVASEVT